MARNGRIAMAAAAAAAGLSLGLASAEAASPHSIPTNLPGTRAYAAPPAGFDAARASDAELDSYGLPPRPDAIRYPAEYAEWLRLVTTPVHRIVPVLQQTAVRNPPPMNLRRVKNANSQSTNWSGYVIENPSPTYGVSGFSKIYGDWVVPSAQQAFGSCSSGWVYSSSWVGIDGFNSNDVLQAGTESDAQCLASTNMPYYSAWYEWYPNSSIRITNLTISGGDDVFVEVWSTSDTAGHAFVEDYTTNNAVSLSFTAPSGTTLLGNSAEWIVERPQVGNALSTLSNYTQDFFTRSLAYDFSGQLYTVTSHSGLTGEALDMIDSYGDKMVLSKTAILGSRTLWFQVSGTAKNSAATAPRLASTELSAD